MVLELSSRNWFTKLYSLISITGQYTIAWIISNPVFMSSCVAHSKRSPFEEVKSFGNASSRRDGSVCSKGHISYPIWSPQMLSFCSFSLMILFKTSSSVIFCVSLKSCAIWTIEVIKVTLSSWPRAPANISSCCGDWMLLPTLLSLNVGFSILQPSLKPPILFSLELFNNS